MTDNLRRSTEATGPKGTIVPRSARALVRGGAVSLLLLAFTFGTSDGQSARQIASSENGVVVAAQPLAAAAGVRMLEMGGNAADAAVATAFAIAVVEPSMNSIGGRNQILIRLPDGAVRGIDGTTSVPLGYDLESAPRAGHGYATVGVPGATAGLMRLHEEYGSLPLEVVMAPAIDYADHGFRLLPGEARRQAAAVYGVSETAGSSRYYLKADGTPYAAGELLVQRDMANTFRTIARDGADAFYRGSIADRIVADMEANGGFVNRESLEGYRAEDSRIVRGSYRGYELVGSDIPASGAVVIEALQIAEHFDRDDYTAEEWAGIIGQSIGLALRDYPRVADDSATVRATSKEWAAKLADEVRVGAAAGGGMQLVAIDADLPPDGHTTHLSTADGSGMAVALTQTIGPNMGSMVATPGLGFLYAATIGGYLPVSEPGERARSGIAPVMVMQDGEPLLVLGAAGGIRIISAVTQAITRVIDDGLALPEALAAPRIHPNVDPRNAGGNGLSVEAATHDGWPDSSLSTFEELGFNVSAARRSGAFGRIHGIQYDAETGVWTGAADPDWEGVAVVPTVDRRR